MVCGSRRALLLLAAGAAWGGAALAQPIAVPPATTGATQTLNPTPASDAQTLTTILAAARMGDADRIRTYMGSLYDPTARKIALWALVDGAPTRVTFAEADQARRDLAGWPHADRRQETAERLLWQAPMTPDAVIAWFGGAKPRTGEGALALGRALNASGRPAEAAALIRDAWRTLVFDQTTQSAMMAAFGAVLTTDDYVTREDLLLYGTQGPAALALLPYLPADQQALAQARMAVRRGDPNADALVAALPMALQNAPGLIYERVVRLRDLGQNAAARQLVVGLPDALPDQDAAERLWRRGALAYDLLSSGDAAGAYAVAAHTGLTQGPKAAEAQFMAGWLALTRLKDPALADHHFALLANAGGSPLTQSRAYYWRGRAAEAQGDAVDAQLFFSQAAQFKTAFYGQLAAQRLGETKLTLGADPAITPADRSAFEARDVIKAIRYLAGIDAKAEFKQFAASLAETLPTVTDEALLTDLALGYGDKQAAMRVVRNAARRGFILPERGYPIVTPPAAYDGPEPAFVLGIVRQESSFDPAAKSGAGARGMMQLMPATAEGLARKLGVPYSSWELDDAQYNMRLGSAYLGHLVELFSGSYVMAAAAYNAGPGRPGQWTAACGDPRMGATDPLDYIECIPFSETRDYVMRVLEATEVYRARLAGGSAPLTLASDLRRGSYSYQAARTSQ